MGTTLWGPSSGKPNADLRTHGIATTATIIENPDFSEPGATSHLCGQRQSIWIAYSASGKNVETTFPADVCSGYEAGTRLQVFRDPSQPERVYVAAAEAQPATFWVRTLGIFSGLGLLLLALQAAGIHLSRRLGVAAPQDA